MTKEGVDATSKGFSNFFLEWVDATPKGFSNFFLEWRDFHSKLTFSAVGSSLEYLSMKKISDWSNRLGRKIKQKEGQRGGNHPAE